MKRAPFADAVLNRAPDHTPKPDCTDRLYRLRYGLIVRLGGQHQVIKVRSFRGVLISALMGFPEAES